MVIVLCALFDTGVLLYLFREDRAGHIRVEDLPFRSVYVGLAELYSRPNVTSPPRKPVYNIPRHVFQVDTTTLPPQMTLTEKEYQWTKDGRVWINDRPFIVNPGVKKIDFV